MDNLLEKIHVFKLEHNCISFNIACKLKNKNIYVEYKCLWQKNESSYFPINLELLRIWRDPDQSDLEDEKISWNANELPLDWYHYFSSGLKVHANILSLSMEF